VPPGGFGRRHAEVTAWLDENCGADGWAMTPFGVRGVMNDAVSIYFIDATLASAFVARWCAGDFHRADVRCGCRSANLARRPGIWAQRRDALIVWKLDRLARSMKHSVHRLRRDQPRYHSKSR
jgi:hypothetical protein